MAIPESYPPAVRAALQHLIDACETTDPAPIAIAVYGSLAKGTYRAGATDARAVIVFAQASETALRAIRPHLRAAWRAIELQPFLLTSAEIARLADVFPVKLADIVAHHQLIYGRDPFTEVVVEHTHLRLRVEQQLRNHLLRLRKHYIHVGDEPRALAAAVIRSGNLLGVELSSLLSLAGDPRGQGTLASVCQPAAERFEFDPALLDRLRTFTAGGSDDDVAGLFFGLLQILERAVHIVDDMEHSETAPRPAEARP